MARDPLQMWPTPQRLWVLFRDEILPETAWDRAHAHAGLVPTLRDWGRFLDRLLLTFGVGFLLAGIIFFFAFNWAALPKVGKFAVVEAGTVVAVALAFWLRLETWGGRLALAASAVMLGVTLAVTGQAYQTGADNYRLFLLWALMITPWVLVSRWNVMWLIWVLLLDTTLSLYWWQVIGQDGQTLNLILALANFSFFMAWSALTRTGWFTFMTDGRWFLYVLALPVFVYVTQLMLDWIFDFGLSYVTLDNTAPLVYLLVAGVTAVYFATFDKDVGMISIVAVSGLVIAASWMVRAMYEANTDPIALFCLSGFAVMGLTTLVAYGLRSLQKRWEITHGERTA